MPLFFHGTLENSSQLSSQSHGWVDSAPRGFYSSTQPSRLHACGAAQEQHEHQAATAGESGKPGNARENTFPLPRYKNIGGVSEEPREAAAKPQIVKDDVRTRASLAEFGITESPWLRATESTGYALAEGECFSPGSVTTLQPRGFVPLVFWFCNRLSFFALFSPYIYIPLWRPILCTSLKPCLSSGPDSVDVQMHLNLEEANKSSLLLGTADVSVAVQPVPLMHYIIEETDPLLVETADISVDVLTDTRAIETADETMARISKTRLKDIRAAWKLTEETNKLLHGTTGTTRNFKVKRRRPPYPVL
ncbi:hypothetical protein B0H14DRAFT_2653384 [Mycena olivaceomarginata]|nr:hypothetical protein B0H14DRAFT_2653384 [Mycena olivaceomarginata]